MSKQDKLTWVAAGLYAVLIPVAFWALGTSL